MSVATRRERERRQRRSRILDAAEKVFSAKGFDQATMDDIATEAELSKGTLYLYFKSKDDLFAALSARMVEVVMNECEPLAREAPNGEAAVRVMLHRLAESILAQPQHFRIMVGQLASGHLIDPEAPSFAMHRTQVERIVDSFIAALERGKADGSLRPDIEPARTSSLLWGGLLGTLLLRINSAEVARRFTRPVDFFDTFVDGYVELVCKGLRFHATKTPSDESEILS